MQLTDDKIDKTKSLKLSLNLFLLKKMVLQEKRDLFVPKGPKLTYHVWSTDCCLETCKRRRLPIHSAVRTYQILRVVPLLTATNYFSQ